MRERALPWTWTLGRGGVEPEKKGKKQTVYNTKRRTQKHVSLSFLLFKNNLLGRVSVREGAAVDLGV